MSEELNAVSYCVGMSIAESLKQQDLDVVSPEAMVEAVKAVFNGETLKYTPEQANGIIQNYVNGVAEKKYSSFKEEGEKFLAENKTKEGVSETTTGLQYEVITEGNGKKPAANDTVKVHYHGTLIDGTVFDSSVSRGEPATFGVHQVIKGWTEALQLMNEGAKYRLYIPQDLAYGANPHPGGAIKPYQALIFDVELLEVL